MVQDYPDGMNRFSPANSIEMNSGFVIPWSITQTITINSGATDSVIMTIIGSEFIYYVDMISVTPTGDFQFRVRIAINDVIQFEFTVSSWINIPLSQCPSLYFLDGDVIKIYITNLYTSARGFYVNVMGSKFIKPIGYGHPPECSFTCSDSTPKINTDVTFTDITKYLPTSIDWDFGDGTSHSHIHNPVHVYTVVGHYTITLTVYNQYGADIYALPIHAYWGEFVNFTTFTEVDPGSDIKVLPDSITCTALPMNLTSYVYRDDGINHYDDINLMFKAKLTASVGIWANGCIAGFDNSVGNIFSSTTFSIIVYFEMFYGVPYIFLELSAYGIITYLDWCSCPINTTFYFTLKRLATSNYITLYIYLNEVRTNLYSTLTIDPETNHPLFRYIYAVCSDNVTSTSTISYSMGDMTIQ